MKKYNIYAFLVLMTALTMVFSCAKQANPFNPGLIDGSGLSSESRSRILSGSATADDLRLLVTKYKQIGITHTPTGPTPNSVITLPRNGKLLVTLRDNDAGWKSGIYMQIDGEVTLLFADNRLGPLNVTTTNAYLAGTEVTFFIVTYAPGGTVYTNRANSSLCRIEYFADVPKWVLHFEDNPTGDFDYNDAVIEVQIAPDPIVDLSACFAVTVDYLDPFGYTPDNLAIYYIGGSMSYNVNIGVVQNNAIFSGNSFVVYAIHEYYEDSTCNRWWYPSPPRPAGEPQTISVKKGDPLPGQTPIQNWQNVTFVLGQLVSLNASYTCPLSVASGNDQTHIIIVHENSQGQIEMTLFDNPVAGVFDPPPTP
jgi:hypothetical protein